MLSVSLFHDFITVTQHHGDEFGQDALSFRLPQSFWFDPKVQETVLFEVFSFIESFSDLRLTLNGDILPSSLSPDFSQYVLFSSGISRLSPGFTLVFDKVIERSFSSLELFFGELGEENYLYIDFDVSSTGFFCSTGTRRLGGYLNFPHQDFLGSEFETLSSMSLICQDSQVIMRLFGLVLSKIYDTLRQNNLDIANIKKLILGGAYGIYFNSLELKSLGRWKELIDFDIVEKDLNYKIICKNLV